VFGLIALAAITVYGICGLLALIATILSVVRARRLPSYWTIAVISIVCGLAYLLWPLPKASSLDGEAFMAMVSSAFSLPMVIIAVGSTVTMAFGGSNSSTLRQLSGLSWGFFTAFVTRVVMLVITYP
jgi:hypothetical protein